MKEKRNLKKLWVEVHPELYDALKKCSQDRGITFTRYINMILLRFMIQEERYDEGQ